MLISTRLLYLSSAIQLLLLGLLQQAYSGWIIALFGSFILSNIYRTAQRKNTLSLKVVNLIAAAALVTLLATAKHSGVLHFMLQILLLAAILRVMGMKQTSDARQLIWVHYFLIGCCFILHQDMLIAVLIMLTLVANLFGHYSLFAPSNIEFNWRQTGQATVIILPLWLAMFVLFPRLPPFWQIPTGKVASTGLSDTLDPGSIEQLVQDDSLAFRVEFSGPLPPKQELYWRSHLYEEFDGRRWQVHALRKQASATRFPTKVPTNATNLTVYRVIAEASQQRNLFALAMPVKVSEKTFITPSGLISSEKPISQRFSYQVESAEQLPKLVADNEKTENLYLPDHNPKTIELARQLKQQYPVIPDLISAIASRFNTQNYYYSLTPPALGKDAVDQFLFSTRTGFCSHYASATALILRAAGIPARVVGGYQGGEWHAEQGYLAVRQREAHAWVEYLVDDAWHRFDPTAAVAPERILNDLSSALSDDDKLLLTSFWMQSDILVSLRMQLMHLDYYWSVWVLGFNEQDQQHIWTKLREHLNTVIWALALLMVLGTVLLLLFLSRFRTVRSLPEPTLLLQQKLASLFKLKPKHQTITAFLNERIAINPERLAWLKEITSAYEEAVYTDDEMALKQFSILLQRHRKNLLALNWRFKNT